MAKRSRGSRGRCLLVTDPSAGGSFALAAPVTGLDLRRTPRLEFDYTIPQGVAIDLFPRVNGRLFRIRLTGPGRAIPGIERFDSIANPRPDEWTHATLDLLSLASPYFADTDPLVLDALHFANYARGDYTLAGIGANWAGAAYRLDDIAFRRSPAATLSAHQPDAVAVRPWGIDSGAEIHRAREPRDGDWCLEARNTKIGGPFGVELACTPFEASRFPVLRFDYRVTDELRVDLIVEVAGSRRQIKFTDNDATYPVIGSLDALADDAWHAAEIDLASLLRAAFPRRASLPVTRLAFASTGWPGNRRDTCYWLDNLEILPAKTPVGDKSPPSPSAPSPAPDAAACTRTITVTLTDHAPGVSPADLRLTVGQRTYSIADPELSFDEPSGLLTLTARGPLGEDGAIVPCELTATDLAGNAMPPLRWTWKLDHSLDNSPPPAPVVSHTPTRTLAANDFERTVGRWGNFVSCQVQRRATGGATGPGCIELTDLCDRPGTTFALVEDFGDEWKEFPILTFRYRARNAPGSSFILQATTFDGNHENWTSLPSFSCTDTWQTGTVDLAAALESANPKLTMHRLFLNLTIPTADGAILIDDYAIYSPAATSAAFRWSAPPDAAGIRGYSWLLAAAADTVPPETITASDTEAHFANLPPGGHCFHIRACDNAGNWGPPTHAPLDVW